MIFVLSAALPADSRKSLTLLSLALLLVSWARSAEVSISVEPPGVLQSGASFKYKGIETFQSMASGVHVGKEVSSFGGSSEIQGEYDHGLEILENDEYGGTHAGDKYSAARKGGGGFSLTLTRTGPNGVNYFGYWHSAVSSGSRLILYSGAQKIFALDSQQVVNHVKTNPEYFGNPIDNQKGNAEKPLYVFLNFYCDNCTLDKVVFTQLSSDTTTSAAGYFTDNHTLGHFTEKSKRAASLALGEYTFPTDDDAQTGSDGATKQTASDLTVGAILGASGAIVLVAGAIVGVTYRLVEGPFFPESVDSILNAGDETDFTAQEDAIASLP